MGAKRNTGLLPCVILISIWICSGSIQRAAAQVSLNATFAPRKEDGEKVAPDPTRLSDIARIKADADSSSGIARVTFEVDEQFRAEAKQPPYLYDWDTLEENDGQHTISVTAYNTKGQTAVKRLKVTVLNQLNLGIKHFVQEGMAGFEQGDYRLLDRSARKAFKISRVDVDAIRLMALDVGIKGDVNRGFQLLDDQQSGVPKYEPFTLRVRGYLTLGRGAGQTNVPAMLPDLESGLSLIREQMSTDAKALDATHPPTQSDYAGQIARGDALFKYGGYDAAVTAYRAAAGLAPDAEGARRAQQRSVIALLRAGRLDEADKLAIKLANGADSRGTGQALRGAVLFQERRYTDARDAVRGALQERNPAALIVATLADLARNDRGAAYGEARDAVNAADTAETQYAAYAALGDAGQVDPAHRTFRIAFLRAPLFMPTLVERAYQLLAYDKSDDRWIQAMNLFDLVLKAEPDNPNALAGRAAVMLHLGRFTSISPVIARMSANEPTAPDIIILKAAAAAKGAESSGEIQKALDRAHSLDPINFNGGNLPRMEDLVFTMIRIRRVVPLTPSLLDIADMPPAPLEKEEPIKSARTN